MNELRYSIVTFGCKLNQFDSARAESILRAGGFAPADDPAQASVIVVNTCTVTGKADHDARKAARRLRRLNPTARLIATGCYAERDPEALRTAELFDDVVGLHERERLPAALLGRDECVTVPLSLTFPDPARAFLKVQEGCDLACSYCIIPKVRGPGRSEPIQSVLRELRALAAAGVREVGLTGVNVGMWGRDLTPALSLADLLRAILDAALPLRIRLNSLEPRTVDASVLSLMAQAPEVLAPHIQIPLQSGSDDVLARMSRNYRTAHYREVIERAKATVPHVCLGADVITGFPGETAAEHAATEQFIASLPLDYLHVFTYSSRPGTRAASLSLQPKGDIVRPRTNALIALGREAARRFRSSQLGRVQNALVLAGRTAAGQARTLTGNYIEVLLPQAESGQWLAVRMNRLENDGQTVVGEVAA